MIKSLHLINFEGHADSMFQFGPGVNIIIGSTDSGKSAAVRATCWVLWNRPSGTSHIRHGQTECRVIIETTDGHTIERYRNKRENVYVVDGEKLAAIGQDVPAIVTRIMTMGDINIQRQFDPHYLLSSSPMEVARHYNALVKLDAIDRGLSQAASQVRQLERNLGEAEAEEEAATAKLQSYSGLTQLSKATTALNADAEVLHTAKMNQIAILMVVDSLKANDRKTKPLRARLEAMRELADSIAEHVAAIEEAQTGSKEVAQLLEVLSATEDRQYALQKELDATKSDLGEIMGEECPLCERPLTDE